MRQLSLVALYGPKQPSLAELLLACQQRVRSHVGHGFEPYEIDQIHATIVSLQRVPGTTQANLNFLRYRSLDRHMDLSGLIDSICSGADLPFSVQIGGFEKHNQPFLSRGQTPYYRSFTVQGDKVVLMGWPVAEWALPSAHDSADTSTHTPTYPPILEDLRRKAQNHNVLHTYHAQPTDVDNDFYLRIGLLRDPTPSLLVRESLEAEGRDYLEGHGPVRVEIMLDTLSLVSWENETLPIGSTLRWPIRQLCQQTSPEFISSLYG